ncbi:phosphatase PAP2 family protein [Corynebacterium sp. L4756]|uniref:phosphatase PAP2 family protein n=1 Tax=unclassified Corynebacterium TaxID=2624378 RepID=UPI00374DD47E
MINPLAEAIAIISTAMSPRYLGVLVLIAAGIALLRKASPWLVSYVPVVFLIAQSITTVLKYTINRERPPLEGQLVYTYDPAFPSGHATAAFSIATALIILILSKNIQTRYPSWIIAGLVVGASASAAMRIYLGVHWPSDVLAGAGIGILVAVGMFSVYRRKGGLG